MRYIENKGECERCGRDIDRDAGGNICGTCADELRDERDAADAEAATADTERQQIEQELFEHEAGKPRGWPQE